MTIVHDAPITEGEVEPVEAQSAADGGERAMEDQDATAEDKDVAYGPHAIAAE